jgi:monofunctional biosynthetic peptidoglycan transglycosylase
MVKAIKRRPYGRKKRGWGGRILGWIVKAILLFIVISVLWVLLYRVANPPVTFTQMGDMLGGRSVAKDWMPLAQIDDDMKRAAIAAEDSKFCSHWGFDQDAIAEAMRRNAQGDGVMRGGSTISQQTAKNAFLWQGGGYFRKGLEAWFTLLIENLWSKERIMEVYLNVAETGIATYGVNAGAQRYFNKDASELSATEAARIAAVLPLPKRREAVTPSGFTRRYGNSIVSRINVVQRDRLDSCLYGEGDRAAPVEREEPVKRERPKAKAPAPAPAVEPGTGYEEQAPAAPARPAPAPPAEAEPEPEPEQPELNGI